MSELSPERFDEYARTYRSRVFAGAAILFSGLALIFFSGCFLIGVLILSEPAKAFDGNGPMLVNQPNNSLSSVLYIMAGVCFLSGLVLLGKGFSSLSKVISERP